LRLTLALALLLSAAALAARAAEVDALDYDATILVAATDKLLDGDVTIRLRMAAAEADLVLDAEELQVTSVEQLVPEPLPATFESGPKQLRIRLPRPAADVVALRIRYTARPKRGVRFAGGETVTYFHTPAWLPCRFDPADRAAFVLHLEVPRGVETLGNGVHGAVEELPDGWTRQTWTETRAYSAYLFGFAAGALLATRCELPHGPESWVLAGELPEAQRRTICTRYPEMFAFLEKVAGVPYPEPRFSLLFAKDGLPQEAAAYAVLSRAYADAVTSDPSEDYLLLHELAHSWWGNLVTCDGWREFWLNEGMVTFLTAAFKEREWGADEYDRERFLARRRMARLAATGKARALVPAEATAEDAGGPVAYSQGALFLHLLRVQLGEAAFWKAIRAYTRAAAGGDRLARTADLEKFMRTSGKDVGYLFAQWARSSERLDLMARQELGDDGVTVIITQRQPALWIVPLRIAVQTDSRRVLRDVVLRERVTRVHVRVRGRVTGVRVDDGGRLPERIAHERPTAMLMAQSAHEPDALGRSEALEELVARCGGKPDESDCAGAAAAFEAARHDRARLVRQLAPENH
jgi:aminopeptidase N